MTRGFAILIVVAVVAVFLAAGGLFYLSYQRQGINQEANQLENQQVEAGNEPAMPINEVSAMLLDFNKADYDKALVSDKLIVLYFYANWCPICREEFPIMQNVFNELNTDKVIGFRVNYNDNQTDNDEINLARQFGVAYQHTKVFIKDNQRILKSPEGWDANRYNTEINKALAQ